MVSLNEITFDVFETLRSHIVDDDDIDKRQIEGFVKDYRADFLKQKFDKTFYAIDSGCVQELKNLPVIKINASTLSSNPIDGWLMRTEDTIPEIVRSRGTNDLLTYISVPNRRTASFEITNYKTAILSGYGRFNRNTIFAFPLNGYIYFYSRGDSMKLLYFVNIRGVFTNPYEVLKVNNPTHIITGDEDFYTPRDLKRYIVNAILKDKYNLMVNPPVDNTNDDTHKLEK